MRCPTFTMRAAHGRSTPMVRFRVEKVVPGPCLTNPMHRLLRSNRPVIQEPPHLTSSAIRSLAGRACGEGADALCWATTSLSPPPPASHESTASWPPTPPSVSDPFLGQCDLASVTMQKKLCVRAVPVRVSGGACA